MSERVGQDERITAAAKRARTTIAFFASVIKSGEQWTLACENEMEQTLAALDASVVEAREVAALTAECERLRAALEKIRETPCGIPGHAVAVGCGSSEIAARILVSESVPAAQEET